MSKTFLSVGLGLFMALGCVGIYEMARTAMLPTTPREGVVVCGLIMAISIWIMMVVVSLMVNTWRRR